MAWPEGSFPFLLSIDVDGDLPLLAENPANVDRLKSRSSGLYGPEHGVHRLLAMLVDLGVTADWFFPGEIARRYPQAVRAVHAAGHPIGVHGNRHLDFDRLDTSGQVEEILGGRAALEEVIGVTTTGFRTPCGEWSPAFPEAMQNAGFTWSSSLPFGEMPYRLTGTDLVEIPFRYELEDLQYFGYSFDPPFPPGQSRIASLESVEANWWSEARGSQRFGTLLHVRVNAELMGLPSRARLLRRFLMKLRQETTACFTSCATLQELFVDYEQDADHPYELFTALRLSETDHSTGRPTLPDH